MTSEWQPDDPRLSRIWLRKELVDDGFSDREIARLVADGTLHRLRHGAYVSGDAWRRCDEVGRHALRARAVVRQARADVVLSHVSALGEWDVAQWDLPLDDVHITREDQKAGRQEAGVHQHLGELRPEDVVDRHGLLVTSVPRTLLDCVSLVDVEHGLAIVNDALHRKLTTMEELNNCVEFMGRWPGSLRHRVVLKLADKRIESIGESRFWHLCWRQGVVMPAPQYEITDDYGRVVAVVDFAWPELRTFVEFDGKVKYSVPDRDGEDVVDVVTREKKREDLIRELTGWRCVRVVWADLYQPEHTAQRLRRAFRQATEVG
jgi:hypothetical protein